MLTLQIFDGYEAPICRALESAFLAKRRKGASPEELDELASHYRLARRRVRTAFLRCVGDIYTGMYETIKDWDDCDSYIQPLRDCEAIIVLLVKVLDAQDHPLEPPNEVDKNDVWDDSTRPRNLFFPYRYGNDPKLKHELSLAFIVLSDIAWQLTHSQCFGPGCQNSSRTERLLKCAGCNLTKYCGRECQKRHWREQSQPRELKQGRTSLHELADTIAYENRLIHDGGGEYWALDFLRSFEWNGRKPTDPFLAPAHKDLCSVYHSLLPHAMTALRGPMHSMSGEFRLKMKKVSGGWGERDFVSIVELALASTAVKGDVKYLFVAGIASVPARISLASVLNTSLKMRYARRRDGTVEWKRVLDGKVSSSGDILS